MRIVLFGQLAISQTNIYSFHAILFPPFLHSHPMNHLSVFIFFVFVLSFIHRFLCNAENYDPAFDFEYRGPVTMKGKAEPMKVWFLNRAESDRHRIPLFEEL